MGPLKGLIRIEEPKEDADPSKEKGPWACAVLEGDIKSNKMKLIQAWIEIHQDELMADWELAASGETVFKIDPLK